VTVIVVVMIHHDPRDHLSQHDDLYILMTLMITSVNYGSVHPDTLIINNGSSDHGVRTCDTGAWPFFHGEGTPAVASSHVCRPVITVNDSHNRQSHYEKAPLAASSPPRALIRARAGWLAASVRVS
jgi:hypothetical protein